jgi:DNA ligase (NAD+)
MQVLTSVTSKTDYLIIGANVGQKKIENANKFDIKILTESDYMALIANINQE